MTEGTFQSRPHKIIENRVIQTFSNHGTPSDLDFFFVSPCLKFGPLVACSESPFMRFFFHLQPRWNIPGTHREPTIQTLVERYWLRLLYPNSTSNKEYLYIYLFIYLYLYLYLYAVDDDRFHYKVGTVLSAIQCSPHDIFMTCELIMNLRWGKFNRLFTIIKEDDENLGSSLECLSSN